jgi:hypothetical protein
MGALMSIIPLALTPIIMKTAGGLLNRFGGIINNPNKGPFDSLRKKAEGTAGAIRDTKRGMGLTRGEKILSGNGALLGGQYSRRRRAASMLGSGFATTSVNSAQKQAFAKAVSEESAQNYFAKRALNDEGFAEGIAGSEAKATSLKAGAQTAVDKILKQDVANREILLTADVRFKNNPQAALDEALQKGDRVQANAAMSMLMKTGTPGYDSIHSSIDKAEKGGNGETKTMEAARDFIKENGQAVKAKDPSLTNWASQDRSKGTAKTLGDVAKEAGNYSKSNAEVAAFAPDALKRAASADAITPDQAKAILENTTLIKDVSPKNIDTLTKVKDGVKIEFRG